MINNIPSNGSTQSKSVNRTDINPVPRPSKIRKPPQKYYPSNYKQNKKITNLLKIDIWLL